MIGIPGISIKTLGELPGKNGTEKFGLNNNLLLNNQFHSS